MSEMRQRVHFSLHLLITQQTIHLLTKVVVAVDEVAVDNQ
jgi:hypothetical protein